MKSIANLYNETRQRTLSICEPLKVEDYVPQPMENVSPPKWHLAHTTWFFEQFVLVAHMKDYKIFDEDFAFLFNSYYNNMGERVKRNKRGFLSRPTVQKVIEYRAYVDKMMNRLFEEINGSVAELIELGVNHEQQHQELLIYDIKYILGTQPFYPSYDNKFNSFKKERTSDWVSVNEGVYKIGRDPVESEFLYDNESPEHKVYLNDFSIRRNLVTNGEYLEFIENGGYENFNLWLDEGWNFIRSENIKSPLYWKKQEDYWYTYNFLGLEKIDLKAPVQHISFYEAAAFAEWKGMRLPTEFEWEVAADLFEWGNLWEWTNSAYQPYPGFKKAEGAIGEYNGKFMINQNVLRGASIATSPNHSRKNYRNFFHASSRWIFNGIRLTK